MQKESLKFLRALLESASPSGYEKPGRDIFRKYVASFADSCRTDVHGNCIAAVNEKGAVRVMLAGHIDELITMVTYINDEGYIHFASGTNLRTLPGMRVSIHGGRGTVRGVIPLKAVHLTTPEDLKKPLKIEELFIDVGAKDKKDAQKIVAVGDIVTIDAGFEELRNGNFVARGCDDRVGAFVVAEAMRLLAKRRLKCAVYGVATVQEEVGLRGARTSAFGIDPHAGIAIDVGHATDHPGTDKRKEGEVKLGGGPILCCGPNINPVLGKMLLEAAKRKKIPYQFVAEPRATGTDANAIQINRAGVAAALVSIPNRYMHSTVETCNLRDLEDAARLLAETVAEITPDTDFTP